MKLGGRRKIKELELRQGSKPFSDWFSELRDIKAKVAIRRALDRIEIDGYFGDVKAVGDGVYEMRFHTGPGYRVYFAQEGRDLVLLVLGGDKGSQSRDIKKAKALWSLYEAERN